MQLAPARGTVSLRASAAPERVAAATWPAVAIAAGLTLLVAMAAIAWGTVRIPPLTVLSVLLDHVPLVDSDGHTATQDAIVWQVRAPRVVLAGLVGATLAFCGAAYQGVFRNPLAEPYLLGVAAGASVGATIVIVSPLFITAGFLSPVPAAAFAGALIAVGLAYMLARVGPVVPVTSLILAGVAVSSLGTSIVTWLMLQHNERTLAILTWILGGFNTASWTDVAIALPYMVVAAAVVLPQGRILNVMQLEEGEARHLGVNVERTRIVVLGLASLATAAAVSVSGLIGFVGLVVPHAVRLAFGPDYRRVLPLSMCFGASFLIAADLLARTLNPTFEVPIGVITALVGAPFFLLLLRTQQRRAMDVP